MTTASGGGSAITVTLDLEDHRPPGRGHEGLRRTVAGIADFLAERSVKASVFVVGEVAREHPDLVRGLADRGHEIGCHGLRHRPLDHEDPERFGDDTACAKAVIEDVAGTAVTGYRAPIFSLTPRTLWAVDILAALGFRYSSSVMPAANPLFGFPSAPRRPFRWPVGLLELPCPVARLGPLSFPYLGGIYLRYLPPSLTRRLAVQSQGQCLWTYCHPFDFDGDEGLVRFEGTGLLTSLLLSLNRRGTYRRMAGVIALGFAPPLALRIAAGEFDQAPVYGAAAAR